LPCASADEALRVFGEHQEHIQLLFTDVMMPRMNGKELAARIRAHKPDTRVLYSSGFGESVIATDGVVDASINYIAKPYRLGELALKLREVLDAARGPERVSETVAPGAPERVDATAE
jgi:two-component system sensor histidine kinase EvgS